MTRRRAAAALAALLLLVAVAARFAATREDAPSAGPVTVAATSAGAAASESAPPPRRVARPPAAPDAPEGDGAASSAAGAAAGPEDPRAVEPRGTLRGVVRDAGGRAVEGARVWVFPAHVIFCDGYDAPADYQHIRYVARAATTDADGRWEIRELGMGGAYGVVAGHAARGESSRANVFVRDESPVGVPDLVFAQRAAVTVTVLRPDGAPAHDAEVLVTGAWPLFRAEDGWSGRRRFEGLPGEAVSVLARRPPWPVATVAVDLAPGDDREVVVRLGEGGHVLTGRVEDDRGEPVAGATVRARDSASGIRSSTWDEGERWPDGPSEASAVTGSDGAFALPGLLEGYHEVRVEAPGHAGVFVIEQPVPADPARFVLVRHPRAVVRLVAPAGIAPPREVRVLVERHRAFVRHFTNEGWDPAHDFVAPWTDDALTIPALPPGRCRVRFVAAGFAPLAIECAAAPGEESDLGTARLEASLPIVGRVVGPDGAGIAGALVRLHDGSVSARTSADGAFRLADVPTGRSPLAAEAYGFLGGGAEAVAGATEPVTIALARAAIFRGRVLNARGEPMAGENVLLWTVPAEGKPSAVGDVFSDHRGVFERPFPPGRYALGRYDPSNWKPPADAQVVDLRAGETTWTIVRR